MAKDFYEILGISRGASDDEIKRAYRKMAQKHHPDRNKGDKASEEKFKEVSKVYEVLSDKQKRQTYDQFGEAAFRGGGSPGGFPGGAGNFDFGGFSGFGDGFADLFETFFSGGAGGGQAQSRAQRAGGDDREATLTVTFEEAAFGTEKEVKLTRIGECEACSGNGATPGTKIITCAACHGKGEIRSARTTIIGQVTTRRVCDTCYGEGKVAEQPCTTCHGIGRTRGSEKMRIKIPAGIFDGSTIRLSKKGDAGIRGGEAGDLFVHIQVQPHKFFRRKDADVYSEQSIHISQAVLGDEIDVDTINGTVKLKVPSGTESGKVFRLKGYGVKKLRSEEKGDHFVTLRVKIPEKPTKKERELFAELAKEAGLKIKEDKGFLKKFL